MIHDMINASVRATAALMGPMAPAPAARKATGKRSSFRVPAGVRDYCKTHRKALRVLWNGALLRMTCLDTGATLDFDVNAYAGEVHTLWRRVNDRAWQDLRAV